MGRDFCFTWSQLLKIVHVIVGLNIGGAELMLKRLIESHVSSGKYQHAVVSLTDIGKVGHQLRACGVDVHEMNMRYKFTAPLVVWRLSRLIRRLNPDIVQTWMYHADLLGGLAARLASSRVIWGVHTINLTGSGSRSTSGIRVVCAALSRWLPTVIVCVAEASRRVHVSLGYCASRMTVIPNGFDLVRLTASDFERTAIRTACSANTRDLIVGSLGRFNHDKDQRNFVQAAALVGSQFSNVRFLIAGRNCDSNNSELVGWIVATGLAERFFLLGERSDVPACLAAMDVYCLSSRSEAFPLVVGEAMALSVPCVITNVGDAALLLGEGGIVVPKEDPFALADGITQLLKMSPAERMIFGKRGHARIKSEFSIEKIRERYEEIYEQVAAGVLN
jgi:glycosyltransferase involved in cell wall biosynthesis